MSEHNSPRVLRRSEIIWAIPEVTNITANYTRYQQPKIRFVNGEISRKNQAIELLVQTSKEFPSRALSLALFIGDKLINDYEIVGVNRYKFYAFDFQNLKQGTPIFIGWPGFPKTKTKTRFVFTLEKQGLV